jgi:outer membrane protein assembly factor BamB/ABC-type transporter MlaC component
MRKQQLAFVGMWIAALAAMGLLYVYEERGRAPGRTRSSDEAVIHDVDEGPTGEPREATLTEAAIPEGPPTEYRGDRRHTGRSPFVGPARPGVFWQTETEHHVVGQAVVDRDGNAYFGSRDHFFYSVSRTGGLRWRRDLGGDIYASPALDGQGHVYVGSDSNFFFCLDAATGEVVWDVRTEGDVDTAVAIGPDGTLVFASGEEVWAVAPDGTTRWRFHARIKIFSAPAIDDDGTVYVGAQDDHVYAIAPDGTMRWSFRLPDDVDSAVVIGDDGTLYFGCDDRRVYALDRNGHQRWVSDVGGYVRAPVALGADRDLIVPIFGPHARVASLDRTTGEERWSFAISPTEATDSGVGSGPVVDAEGNVYFGADDDFVYAIDRRGALRWVFQAGGNVDGDPVITPDGTLLVGADDHHMYALRADAIERGADAGVEMGPATQQVRQQNEEILRLLGTPASDARDEQLVAILTGLLDVDAMGGRALGSATLTAAQRTEFDGLLRRLVERNYRENLERLRDYRVTYSGQETTDDGVVVHASARSAGSSTEPAVEIDYAMHLVGSTWRAFDVVTDGASLVQNYQAQFNRIITRDGVDALLQRMRDRLARPEASGQVDPETPAEAPAAPSASP